MSKLDHFLISQHVTDVFTDVKVTALPRGWSDHTLIMLHCEKVDYGHVLFKLFHSWLQRDRFDDCVKMAYNECCTNYPLMPFHEKLKVIKQHIKIWTHQVKNVEIDRKQEIISNISDIEEKIHSNIVSEVEKEDRMKLLKERDDFQRLEDMDVVIDPQHVKMTFHNFYKDKFDVLDSLTELPHVVPFATLSQEDSMELEKSVTLEEIRAAVWDCGSQKSLGPDGFSFLFLKSYWELLKEDVGNSVRCVLELFVMPRKWINSDEVFFMINIYAPQKSIDKLDKWNRLLEFIRNHDGHFVIFGDLNEVRDESERYGTEFCRSAANVFNAFIDDARLFETVLGGRNFTWMSKAGTK
nr:RNA-directed DNA polymerase, eukaryota, reverse transcriptase zinc-binding domain protein [Tanacetum cinerariifolium]